MPHIAPEVEAFARIKVIGVGGGGGLYSSDFFEFNRVHVKVRRRLSGAVEWLKQFMP